MALDESAEVPAGTVKVRPHPTRGPDGQHWFLIEIGRGRYVKRLNISESDARQILAALVHLLP